jgi:adenylate cyclase
MDARLKRKLLALATLVAIGMISSMIFSVALGYASAMGVAVGASYGLLLSLALGAVTFFVMQGPMRGWLASLSFAADLAVRSAIYAAIILPTQFFQLGALVLGQHYPPSLKGFWISMVYSVVCVILFNLVIGVTGLIGGRTFVNFISGRYHSPVEENRFVLFVDIVTYSKPVPSGLNRYVPCVNWSFFPFISPSNPE